MNLFPSSSLSTIFFFFLLLLLSLGFTCVLLSIMTIRGGTNQACAVCKYQRRKCTKDCPLAPYFPSDQPKMFQNAHRLFGVRNIMNILKQVNDDQKEEAMRSIIYESDIRARFPVHGCLGVVRQLRLQLRQTIEEFRCVTAQLAIYKDQSYYHEISPSSNMSTELSSSLPINAGLPIYQQHSGISSAMPLPPLDDFLISGNPNIDVYGETNLDDDMVKHIRVQHPYCSKLSNYSSSTTGKAAQTQLLVSQQGYPFQQEMQVSYDYEDLPIDTSADDGQPYIESKDYAWKSSLESSLKNTMQSTERVTENELNNDVTRLSLTSIK